MLYRRVILVVKRAVYKEQPNILLASLDGKLHVRALFHEAHKRGIKTRVLQWAQTYEIPTRPAPFFRRLYIPLKKTITNRLCGLPHPKTRGIGTYAQSMGVINSPAYELFSRRGIPLDRIKITGSLDFHEAQQTKQLLDNDLNLRQQFAKKYGLTPGRLFISIFTTPFDRKDFRFLDETGQRKYYEDIVKEVRNIFPLSRAQIYIKPHPAEDEQAYAWAKSYDVRILSTQESNEHIVYFSDLYIDHHSTTNYIPIYMNKSALFLNLMRLPEIEAAKENFGIREFIYDLATFSERLKQFANGSLPKQYDRSGGIVTGDSLKKIINWLYD